MALETLIGPVGEPVTIAAARAYLRIGSDGDDTVLASLITACREGLEARIGRALVTRTLRQRFLVSDRFRNTLPGTLLPGRVTATALVAVRTIAGDGTEALAADGLVSLVDGRFIINRALPSGAIGLSIDYVSGYGPPEAVPEAFKVALLEAVGDAMLRRDNGKASGDNPWDQALNEVKL